MGMFGDGQGLKAKMREYYDTLRTERWKGEGRFAGAQAGRQIHLRQTKLLGGVYLLKQFRTTEPRLLTVARYGVAPILNTTKIGKIANTSLNVLRAGKTFGVGMEQTAYPDLPLDNPLKRVTQIFSKPDSSKEILNKYGLKAKTTNEHGTIYKDDMSGGLTYEESEFEDLIPVKFRYKNTDGEYITHQVRGAIGAVSDTITPMWNETTYVGRPDSIQSYGGFAREFAFDLTLAAMNENQLYPMWEKINRIATFVLPQLDPAAPMTRYAGKLCEVTIGHYLQRELCAMTAFTITPHEAGMWEVGDPWNDHPSLTLAHPFSDGLKKLAKDSVDKIKKKGKTGTESADGKPYGNFDRKVRRKAKKTRFIMPRVVTINIGLKVLHTQLPGDPGTMTPLFRVPNMEYKKQGPSDDPLT